MSTRDRVQTTESIHTEVTRIAVPPLFPCAVCGRETLEHVRHPSQDPEARVVPDCRVCSSPMCRNIQELTDDR